MVSATYFDELRDAFKPVKPVQTLESYGLSKDLSDDDIKAVIETWKKEIKFVEETTNKSSKIFYADLEKVAKLKTHQYEMNGDYGPIVRIKIQFKAFKSGTSLSAMKKMNDSLIRHYQERREMFTEFEARRNLALCKKIDSLGELQRYISGVETYDLAKAVIDLT